MNNKEFEFKVGDIVGHVLWDGEFELKEKEIKFLRAMIVEARPWVNEVKYDFNDRRLWINKTKNIKVE